MPNPQNIIGQGFHTNPERINKDGRPKKIYTILKESGYTRDDIKEAFAEIGWQTADDIEAIIEDETKPMIVRLIAKAFKRGTEKGDFRYVSEILQHTIGKPKEQTENKHLHKIVVEYVKPENTTSFTSPGTAEDIS